MKRKILKIGAVLLSACIVFGVYVASCTSSIISVGDTAYVDYSLIGDASNLTDQHSKILVTSAFSLNSPVSRNFNTLATAYVLPPGVHTISGEYRYFKTIPDQTVAGIPAREPAGTVRFNINHRFLPGQFYYLVGDVNVDRTPRNIRIITDQQLDSGDLAERPEWYRHRRTVAENKMSKGRR